MWSENEIIELVHRSHSLRQPRQKTLPYRMEYLHNKLNVKGVIYLNMDASKPSNFKQSEQFKSGGNPIENKNSNNYFP